MDTRTVVRALKTPVTLLLLAGFVVWAANWAWDAIREPIPEPPLPACVVTEVGPQLTPEHVYVRVLNGTSTGGLANRLGAVLRADGFNVFQRTNAPTADHEISEVVGSAEDAPEVVLLRQAFTEIAFRADGRTDATVDVIIGTQQPVAAEGVEFGAPLPDGRACLAQIELVNTGE